jgi:predicted aspartyl protease
MLFTGVGKMKIELIDYLLQTSMTVNYNGNSIKIDNLVIDTGAAHSLLSSDVVSQIGIKFQNGDKLVRSFGIGGDEYSFRKRVDQIQLGSLILNDISIDFGVFHEDIDHINGLIGLDILKSGEIIIDLQQMEMYPAKI